MVTGVACVCDKLDEGWGPCEVHVTCDEKCMALRQPVDMVEIVEAYTHWKYHGMHGGCSHGQ